MLLVVAILYLVFWFIISNDKPLYSSNENFFLTASQNVLRFKINRIEIRLYAVHRPGYHSMELGFHRKML